MKRIMRPMLALATFVSLALMTPAFADEPQTPDYAADALKSPSDPPVIPHAVKPDLDGEACNACHRTGLNNAPPTDHPERLNCTSCHVQGAVPQEKESGKTKKK